MLKNNHKWKGLVGLPGLPSLVLTRGGHSHLIGHKSIVMNSMKLVIPLYFISWKKDSKWCCDTTKPEPINTANKANAVPRLLSSLVWIDHYHECNGMTSFMEFTWCEKDHNNTNVLLLFFVLLFFSVFMSCMARLPRDMSYKSECSFACRVKEPQAKYCEYIQRKASPYFQLILLLTFNYRREKK